MLMEVIVEAAVHNNKIELRESFMATTMPAPRRTGNVFAIQSPCGKSDVGWVERSDTHRLLTVRIGALAIGQSTFERMMSIEQLAAVSLIGSPAEIRREVKAYSDAGVSHFEIKFIYPTLERHSEMLQLFAREVLPAFR
jgi:alkanesulfonate monooxygenase SsuD/methylene tetrahydromethanopterin reductase-like flavin-dependent oxidoreductase (luciferase family)